MICRKTYEDVDGIHMIHLCSNRIMILNPLCQGNMSETHWSILIFFEILRF